MIEAHVSWSTKKMQGSMMMISSGRPLSLPLAIFQPNVTTTPKGNAVDYQVISVNSGGLIKLSITWTESSLSITGCTVTLTPVGLIESSLSCNLVIDGIYVRKDAVITA